MTIGKKKKTNGETFLLFLSVKKNFLQSERQMRPSTVQNDSNEVRSRYFSNFVRSSSFLQFDRFCFILIHLIFSTVLFSLIYLRLKQINDKQIKFIDHLTANRSFLIDERNRADFNSTQRCSCEQIFYPKRNRTNHCLQIRVGFTEMVDNVFCSMSNRNAWLIIQNRQTNRVDFNRTWTEYRRGFGNVQQGIDFWIGNDNLYWLTNKYRCRLRIELTDWENETRVAIYEQFFIGNHREDYRIHLADYRGNIEGTKKVDVFSRWHYNVPFSTYDRVSTEQLNCPKVHGGAGWWYHHGKYCAHVQLNGQIPTHSDGLVPYNHGIQWISWKSDRHYSFQRVQMSIQQKGKTSTTIESFS